jgi:hypothetical protein
MKQVLISLAAIVCLTVFTLHLTGGVSAGSGYNDENEKPSVSTHIRLIFAGDVMGHSTQINGAWRDGGDSSYNFIRSFQWVKDYISSADIAVANFEVTLAGEPYTG